MTYLPEPVGHLPVPAGHTREVEAFGQTRGGDRWAVRTREETSYADPGAAMPHDRSGSAVVAFIGGAMAAELVSLVTVYFLHGLSTFVVLAAVFVAIGGGVTLAAKR